MKLCRSYIYSTKTAINFNNTLHVQLPLLQLFVNGQVALIKVKSCVQSDRSSFSLSLYKLLLHTL